ncbi:MAG TPA: prolipoprotein diacylglyceryl transferase [Ohtaekwangia sp.]
MHPVLFELGSIKVYSYGFMIAIGAVAGIIYMVIRGRKEIGLTFDQANGLFLSIFIAAVVGGKVFLFFEDVPYYTEHPGKLFSGSGFVFYGSFLFAIPTMLWFFNRNKLPKYAMLDIMAGTTCLVHMFGRVGCFMAGCCHGKPVASGMGVIFTDPACHAEPKGVPLHAVQLYEAGFILLVFLIILFLRRRRKFYGQLFLTYLLSYAVGRYVLEFFRGDMERGFIIQDYLSHSQLVAIAIAAVTAWVYMRWSKQNRIDLHKKPI